MPFTATCPSCDARQRVRLELRGKPVTCLECGEAFTARPPARKSSSSQLGTYVLLGALAFLVIAGGILVFVLLKRLPQAPQAAATPPPAPGGATPGVAKTIQAAPVTPAPAAPAPQLPADVNPAVNVDTLRREIGKDEARVEGNHKDRQLDVTGTVTVVLNEPPLRGVMFGSLQDPVPPILCELGADQADRLAKLKPGQKITISGIYKGRLQSGHIGMMKCEILPK